MHTKSNFRHPDLSRILNWPYFEYHAQICTRKPSFCCIECQTAWKIFQFLQKERSSFSNNNCQVIDITIPIELIDWKSRCWKWKKLEAVLLTSRLHRVISMRSRPAKAGFFVPEISASIATILYQLNMDGLHLALSKCGYKLVTYLK